MFAIYFQKKLHSFNKLIAYITVKITKIRKFKYCRNGILTKKTENFFGKIST